MPAKLAGHMEEHGCLPVLYLSAWLLTAYASAFPLTFATRVVDVMLTDSYPEPMMKARACSRAMVCAARVTENQTCRLHRGYIQYRLPDVSMTFTSYSCRRPPSSECLMTSQTCSCGFVQCRTVLRRSLRLQVALGIIRAAEKHLLAMDDMEEMVEFMKTDVPNWDMQTLQARGPTQPALAIPCRIQHRPVGMLTCLLWRLCLRTVITIRYGPAHGMAQRPSRNKPTQLKHIAVVDAAHVSARRTS